jgi:acetyl esterase
VTDTTAPLHPQVEALRRERLASGFRPVRELTVAEARAAELAELAASPAQREPVAEIVEHTITGPARGIPVRIYRPEDSTPSPVLVYFFGGGWVLGSLDAVDPVCRRLANATPCAVVSVGYRRAPEHPFPAGLEDCYAVTEWVAAHVSERGLDGARLAVGGASSGGNLAAAVALLARRRGGPRIRFQLLVYPPLDRQGDRASSRSIADPVFLDGSDVAWCWSHYLAQEVDGADPLASPLREPELAGLPPALVITAERDPLRDEGERYARRLTEAGVATELVRFDGVVHGFFSLGDRLETAREAQALAAAALGKALRREPDDRRI